jgi:hypothetical protein
MSRSALSMVCLGGLLGCGDSAPTVPPPPPPGAPVLATITLDAAGRRVQGFVGAPLPDDVISVVIAGPAAGTEAWTATSRRGWASFEVPAGVGSTHVHWARTPGNLGAGLHVDTIEVALTAHPGVFARLIDTLELLPPPSALTMLVSPRSRMVRVAHGDLVPDGSVTVTLAPTPSDGAAWCVRASVHAALLVPAGTTDHCDATQSGGTVRWRRDVAGRGPGIHVDTIEISRHPAIHSPQKVLDSLVILPGPGPFTFTLSDSSRSDTIDVGGSAVEDAIQVELSGKASAQAPWTAAVDGAAGWITLVTGVGAGPGELRWRRNPTGLAAGVYHASIVVSLPGDLPRAITIADTLVVRGPDPGSSIAHESTRDGWASREYRVTSPTFANRGHGASVKIGGTRLPLVRVDATTLQAQLPDTIPGGTHVPRLLLDGYEIVLSSVRVAGFVARTDYTRTIPTDAYAWPRDGAASVLGQTSEGLTLFNLDAGTSSVLPIPSTSNIRGPGATPDPDVYLIRNGDALQSWRLRPVPGLVEVYDDFYGDFTRQAMLLNPDAMFIAPGQHLFQLFTRTSAGGVFQTSLFTEQAEEVEGVYMSPRRDRATVRVDGVTLGVPVFDATTGTIGYRTQLRTTYGVDWSPDGSVLVLGGRSLASPFTPRLMLINPTDGSVLAEKTFEQSIAAVAWDDVRPIVYVALEDGERGPTLLVLDRTTLAEVARMRPPGVVEFAASCCYRAVIAPSRTTDTVHLFWFRWSWEFTLPN